MASGRLFVVFVLPVILSITLAGAVMADVLDKPGRDLDMWPGASSGGHGHAGGDDGTLHIVGLSGSYLAGEQLAIRVSVTGDGDMDPLPWCGDLYITIYDRSDAALVQEAFFAECVDSMGAELPAGGDFVAALDSPGSYTVVAEMRVGEDAVSAMGEFVVE